MAEQGTGMSSFVKALVVVFIGIAVIGTIVIFGAWMWWKKNQTTIISSTTRARDEGYRIGKQNNEQGCFDLAIARAKEKEQFTQMLANGIFLGSCLEQSKASKGFCSNIPSDREFARSVQWRMHRCKELKLDNNTCSALLSVVQRYCHDTRATLGKHE
ncbi:MAG TPA: hypothetical protein VH815_00205 [Acidobacteriota bacterium]|jgi:hypothetical protein